LKEVQRVWSQPFFCFSSPKCARKWIDFKKIIAAALAKVSYHSSFSILFNYKEAPLLLSKKGSFFKE